MAKLRSDAIVENDLLEFLNNYSDFSFEVEVLRLLVSCGFECEHGGSYKDPVTNKTREFDIRATIIYGTQFFLRLAVECKNLRENFPLLVSCIPRKPEEAFHEICVSVKSDKNKFRPMPGVDSRTTLSRSKNFRLTDDYSNYKTGILLANRAIRLGVA